MIDISSKLTTLIKNDSMSGITAFLYILNNKEINNNDEQLYANVSKSNVCKPSK